MGAFMETFNTDLAESGELVETRALAAPVHTRRFGAKDGVPVVTDGPYAETQEVLAGYWIVECDSFDRATEIAARLATARPPSTSRPPRTPTSGRSSRVGDELGQLSRADRTRPSRTCCASWRRRSSVRWSGATATSTPPRTRPRRRCSPRRSSGRRRASRTTRAAG